MAKPSKSTFVCQNCGAVSPRWAGKCPSCGEWNTLVEEADAGRAAGLRAHARSEGPGASRWRRLQGDAGEAPRFSTGIAELDRVTGGGIVPGSALLIGGEPGIGKSTLLLQLAAALRPRRPPRHLFLRRGGRRAGAPARRTARSRRRAASRSRARPTSPTSSRRSSDGKPRRPRRHRFDPDALGRGARGRARHRQPGPRRRPSRSSATPSERAARCCLSATSPRTARSPARR